MIKAAIYARFSSQLQRDESIDDQVRLCRRLMGQHGWSEYRVYFDKGISGASSVRPAYQKLLEDARHGEFDVVVAEGLDRISRDQEHIAAFYKQMQFQGVSVVTVAEGEISELHIGLKGTMSSLFLKDLAQKTHRGQEGRVRAGKSAGGKTYGYGILRSLKPDGEVSCGDLEINVAEAAVVRRIFEDYSHGLSPRAIAAKLNGEGIVGPRGTWGPSTINGNGKRGTGILNNELYVGRRIWNRQRFIKDPITGKRQARPNPSDDWVVTEVPELRIMDNALWDAVKRRQDKTRSAAISDGLSKLGRTKRARHLLSGLLICGSCGGGFTQVGKQYYGCANQRNKGTCDNRLTIKRLELEDRVLNGLKDKLLHPELVAEFVRTYQQEALRLSGAMKQERAAVQRELDQVNKRIEQLVDAIADGLLNQSLKDGLNRLEDTKIRLESELTSFPEEEPVLLHPSLAGVYRRKVEGLQAALNSPLHMDEAKDAIRSLFTSIRLVPIDGTLAIELVGELAGLLALGPARKDTSRTLGPACSSVVVAGVGFEPTTFRL